MKNATYNRISRLLPLLVAVGLAFAASTVSAGVNVWTTNGPEGGDIRALAIDPANPATLYAGTSGGGVLKSTNGGESWTAINTGLTGTDVRALAIDPVNPVTLYAGTWSGGVFKSTNGGGSWSATPYIGFPVQALAINPSTPAMLYAGTYGGGVFKSTNSGGTWAAANTGLGHFGVQALIINPANPATLYAATSNSPSPWDYCDVTNCGGGVFKSTDSGGTWAGASTSLTNLDVKALAIDPTTPATLYAGTHGGVFKSTDSGGTAAAANAGLTSTDVRALAIDPANPATLYAGTSGGVLRSANGGGSWTAINTGLTNADIRALAIDPANPATLYAGTSGGGVFKSTNGGGTWTASNSTTGPCVANATTLCLNNSRYKVQTRWSIQDGSSGVGQVINISGDTGAFWFFTSSSLEIVIKVLNGCAFNSRYWTFAGGLTNVNVVLTVTDTQTGTIQTYTNPQGTPFEPIQDTNAFATCP